MKQKKIFLEAKKLVFLKKKLKKFQKKIFFDFFFKLFRAHPGKIIFFLGNPFPLLFRNHIRLPACQISEKSTERLPRIVGNRRTDGLTNERSLMHRTIFPHIFGRSKNGLHHFLGEPSGYLHAKFQKNLPSGYREKLVTN